ncbi:replication protein A 70 kDa DNA-binding subunit A-like [Mercurialis annua]|uniref:replication protein A 70 kDa DNA-binding subunit A-like n=1 Tax=Mercurialis annua TaxID=3986 RepID=UPI0024ADE342|nr:replication protein A 70 kDa DNA-binding subunit A-like [Mercurialis annua]
MASIQISDISKETKNVKFIARVARTWNFINPHNADDIYSFEFLLIDEKGTTIQGTVGKNIADKFRPLLSQGNICCISGFIVMPAQNNYKISDHAFRIKLLPNATIKLIDDVSLSIPFDKFNLLTFDELKDRIGKIDYLCDAIGQLVTMENIQQIRISNRIKNKRTVFIQDSRNEKIEVTLWEKTAMDFPEEQIIASAEQEPVIVVFAAMTVKSFNDATILSGTSATKLYINPELPEIVAFLQSLPNPPAQFSSVVHNSLPPLDPESEKNTNRKTIAELLDLDIHTDKDEKFTCEAVIKEIDASDGWWYRACARCKSGIQSYNEDIYCKNCGVISDLPIPWYKLTIMAEDNTGIAPFIIFGNMATELVGLPASSLSTMSKDRCQAPALMARIYGLKKQFQIKLSDRIHDSSELSFKVIHIFKDTVVIKKETPSPTNASSSQLLIRDANYALSSPEGRKISKSTDESSTSSATKSAKKSKIE